MESLTRRRLIHRSAKVGLALGVAPGTLGAAARARAADAGPSEVHLSFGGDPSREMNLSWTLPAGARNPRLSVGPAAGQLSELMPAELVAVVDNDARSAAAGNHTAMLAHGRLTGLAPGGSYVYQLTADGMAVRQGTFQTAPAGRAAYRFTAFGDQGTGDTQDVISAPAGSWVVDQVEALAPVMHLHLGDLVYANLNQAGQRGPAWERFMTNNARSAANRPWMPILGNHEIETGNGPLGYSAYTGRFRLPANGSSGFAQLWYAFTVGSVRFIAVDAEDWCLQKGGDIYNNGYSKGEQVAWFERELATSRDGGGIDWVVLLIHHPLTSSADQNGSDLGTRKVVLPLLEKYDVDLVLSGHDHFYERSLLLGPPEPGSPSLRPSIVDHGLDDLDTTRGYVQMVIGGAGTKLPPTDYDADKTTAGEQAPYFQVAQESLPSGREDTTWVAKRDDVYPFGFASFAVDPGSAPGGSTKLRISYYRTAAQTTGVGTPTLFDEFTLVRPRADAPAATPVRPTPAPAKLGLSGRLLHQHAHGRIVAHGKVAAGSSVTVRLARRGVKSARSVSRPARVVAGHWRVVLPRATRGTYVATITAEKAGVTETIRRTLTLPARHHRS